MKILLVYPPYQFLPTEIPRADGGLGLLYLAGALREIGIEADILDANIGSEEDNLADTFYKKEIQKNGLIKIGMSWERLREYIAKGNYDIIGIHSNHTFQTKMVFKAAEIIREVSSKSLLIAGGINAKKLYERFKKYFDIVCCGEGEQFIQKIAQSKNFNAEKPEYYQNLDELPFPAWDKLQSEKYKQIAAPHGSDLTENEELYAPLMTSRGCIFKCLYCHNSTENIPIRFKSIERIIKEIVLLENLGIKKIFIEDDSFLANKQRVKEIFNLIKDRNLTIMDVNGVNLIHLFKDGKPDYEFMKFIFDAGFKQIVFPVESGCQRILNKYCSAKLNLEKFNIPELVKTAKKIGIKCPVNIMIGFPDETEEEVQESIEYSRKLIEAGTDYVSFFIATPFPGSQLYNIAIEKRYLKKDFDTDKMNYQNVIMENTIIPREKILELRDFAWRNVNTKEHIDKRLQKNIYG